MKKIWLMIALFPLLLAGCGEETDPRISDADAICLKIIRAGGSCSGSSATETATVTSVSTVTITSTTY